LNRFPAVSAHVIHIIEIRLAASSISLAALRQK
jgi:hypothetical protein